ncbi:hypothetical protein JW978_04575 [Candidatus Dojkabacteria bacterium]|nr:hypothetical protein [Candidatus Dojkabacteria bacterium]
MKNKFVTAFWMSLVLTLVPLSVQAQSILPENISGFLNDWSGSTVTEKIVGFLRLALTLAFGAVILVAVLFSIMAAIKYIRSQGDSGKVEEANNAIKAIFQGVAAMFVGFIGIVIVFFIFDVALPDPTLPNVCLTCPESEACKACSEGKKDDGNYVVKNSAGAIIYSTEEGNCNLTKEEAETVDCAGL